MPLTPECWDDFVTLFSEHGVQNGCWCTYWRLTREQFHRQYYGEKSKQLMHSIVQAGRVPGILAYCNNRPVGWCSIAPRDEFPSLDRSTMLKRVDEQPVWSIVCFFISQPYREEGLSGKLVEAAIDYTRQNGASIIEAYPINTTSDHCQPPERYMGVLSTFQKAGFRTVADRGGKRIIMRLDMKQPEVPSLQNFLPGLMHFARDLAWSYRSGTLLAEQLHRKIVEFFTNERMEEVDKIIPGWIEMASFARGQTLVHTVCMMLATLASPEYAQATDEQRRLLEWIALLHDLGKQATELQPDHAHAFRSAALAGRILPNLGFGLKQEYTGMIDDWQALINRAVIVREDAILQDNTYLAEIMAGIWAMYGAYSHATSIISCILLQMSLETVPEERPCPVGLDSEQVRQLIAPDLIPLLTAMMVIDSDAWNLYDPTTKERYRAMTYDFINKYWPAQKLLVNRYQIEANRG